MQRERSDSTLIAREEVDLPEQTFFFDRQRVVNFSWQGTLLVDKADETRTNFRRNRYYDPASGRFTQEDPIGLAGGLNLYGYAGGDPANNSDPFGLCPPRDRDYSTCNGFFTAVGVAAGALIGGTSGGAGGAALCAVGGPIAIACAAGGGVAGAAKGALVGGAIGAYADALSAMARAGKGGGNSAENRGSNYWARKLGLNNDGTEQLKRTLEEMKRNGESITDDALEDAARGISQIPKYAKPPQ